MFIFFIGGYYCGAVGQSSPTDVCEAGFYCRQYANTSTPNLGYDADVCPQGNIIDLWREGERGEGGRDGRGYYCGAVGQSSPTDVCEAGFCCRQYANTSTPNMGYDADICPQGNIIDLRREGERGEGGREGWEWLLLWCS